MQSHDVPCQIKGVLLDFGGVMAEEGFRNGLAAIAGKNGKDAGEFFDTAVDLMKGSGYLTGDNDENTFWRKLRLATGIQDTDEFMRGEILSRFVVRDWMLVIVDALKLSGMSIGMLSDQTNWLDELEQKNGFMRHFDMVMNSFHVGRSKYDARVFDDAAANMELAPGEILFVDDTLQHVERARTRGLKALHYTFDGPAALVAALQQYCPDFEVDIA